MFNNLFENSLDPLSPLTLLLRTINDDQDNRIANRNSNPCRFNRVLGSIKHTNCALGPRKDPPCIRSPCESERVVA